MNSSNLNQNLLSNIKKAVPYVPGEQPTGDVVKLNTNENPYPPSPLVTKRLQAFQTDTLRKYPEPTMSDFVHVLAKYHNVNPEQVFIGIGSDDVLALSFLTYFSSGKPLLFPDITYSFYDVWANLFGIPYKTIKLGEEFVINPNDYVGENGGIILPNPNAPTGRYEALDTIKTILDHNPNCVVIIDEAYIDFVEQDTSRCRSALSLLDNYPNLVVVRTYSKSRAMAGIRIGYAIGHQEVIQLLYNVKYAFNSYTLSQLSYVCGIASIEDESYFQNKIAEIIQTRKWFISELLELGFECIPTQANFVFGKHPSYSGVFLFDQLKKRNIYVRHFNKDRIENYLRISIGTNQEMLLVINALKEIIT